MFIFVLLGYTLLAIYEYVPLYKQREMKDFWVNTTLGIISFTIAMLLSFGVKIPSPEAPIREVITSLFGK